MNPLKELQNYGQSPWLDYIRRSLLTSGELLRMVDEDGLRGVTANPTIFEKAIAGSEDYDATLADLLKDDPHKDAKALYEKLAVKDVQMAADILRPVYDKTNGADGFVSLELSPGLANDTEGSIDEARYFWNLIGRPNLLIKVPATPEGIPAIEALIAEGINVNITLMFSLSHYEAVANAYIRGLEKCPDPSKVASVASFFVSRVDAIVDKALEENGSPEAHKLRGKIAIANSKMAYKRFKELFSGKRWERLAKRGAKVQRVLWASTSTKNPEYSDVLYVEELIGKDTVNTIPPATLNAFRDHGKAQASLEERTSKSEENLEKLKGLGIDLNALTEKLQIDGLKSFSDSFDALLSSLEEKRTVILHGHVERLVLSLGDYQASVDERLDSWKKINFNRRLWEKDPTLWFDESVPEITNRLGWLNLPEMMHEQLDTLVSFADEVKNEGIRFVVLLGMGGSSLASGVYQKTFGNKQGYPELTVLDSTHPDAVRGVEEKIDLESTLFIVGSKSGTTLEPLSFFKYFWEKMGQVDYDTGRHFIAVTDPGTPLVELAREKGFRRIFLAPPDLGGRYSALTVFGLVSAALIGMDVHRFIDRAWVAAEGCAFCVSEQKTPGLGLGAALGELAKRGVDKVTFMTSPSLESFPNWLEQLIAESTGKNGRGVVPIVGESLSSPNVYGMDRFFVYFHLEGDKDLEYRLKKFEALDHPVARIRLTENYDIGLEIFRWEVAVAAAGAVMDIHPFNQPDVELAKDLARQAMKKDAETGGGGVETVSIDSGEFSGAFKDWLSQAKKGDYVAIQAYLSATEETTESLKKLRLGLLKKLGIATTVGFGPRFLHSTGQLHKGGTNNGLFLQLVDEPSVDLSVPGADYTFGDIIRAQAVGDFQALKNRGRKVLRVNMKNDVLTGLSKIIELLNTQE
ncbi:MAG: bifunctional transaldolase/phosoglucose isomerase [Candidatus Hydrothermarchaeales archaeon]